jgi:hypothetical protein
MEVSQSNEKLKRDLYKDGFELSGLHPSTYKQLWGKHFVIPEAPEPPHPLCLVK